MVFLELARDDARLPRQSEVRWPPGIDILLPIAETGAEDARDSLVPGKLHECLRIGNADEFGRLRPVADILPVAIDEEVRRRAVDELESALGRRSQ